MSFFLRKWFHPTIDAIFGNLPFQTRWRLLLFQPVAILIYSINTIPNLFFRRFSSIRIPTRSGSVHAILFQPPKSSHSTRPRPLHLDIHGGGFLGGHPEADYRFCTALSDRTGAVVVGATHRFAPKHPFPAAIDDIDDVVQWLIQNAAFKFNADPSLFTISGSSAGGNLALATCLQPSCHGASPTAIKAAITFYAAIDLRIPPIQKPVPPNFPTKDPSLSCSRCTTPTLPPRVPRASRIQGVTPSSRMSRNCLPRSLWLFRRLTFCCMSSLLLWRG